MARDGMSRRSRFARTPKGKRILLTERDTQVLRLLCRYRFLRASQLVAFLRPKSEKRCIERLGDIYHETGLIDRPSAQWRRFDARYQPIVYELSAKGACYLESLGRLPPRATTLARRGGPGATPQFDHAMMIVDAPVAVVLATLRERCRRFLPVNEILARAPEQARNPRKPLAVSVTIRPGADMPRSKPPFSTHVVPGALHGIEYLRDGQKLCRFVALECENTSPAWRSRTNLSSLGLKKAAYDRFSVRAHTRLRRASRIWHVRIVHRDGRPEHAF